MALVSWLFPRKKSIGDAEDSTLLTDPTLTSPRARLTSSPGTTSGLAPRFVKPGSATTINDLEILTDQGSACTSALVVISENGVGLIELGDKPRHIADIPLTSIRAFDCKPDTFHLETYKAGDRTDYYLRGDSYAEAMMVLWGYILLRIEQANRDDIAEDGLAKAPTGLAAAR